MKKWDSDLIEKEFKDGVELGVVATCLEFDQGKSEAEGREALLDRVEGREWGGMEIWVELESFMGILMLRFSR